MIHRLKIDNFSAFKSADIEFGKNLNIVIGENGTGKTHILKLIYSILYDSYENSKKTPASSPTKKTVQNSLAEKLINVFRPESLGGLYHIGSKDKSRVEAFFSDKALDVVFEFGRMSRTEISVGKLPEAWNTAPPVFFPTRELLSIYPKFVSFYESYFLEFEETFRDTCLFLGLPPVRDPKRDTAEIMASLEKAMGGKVELDNNGRFYLKISSKDRIEMPLVAEGLRKLAMICQLLANGTLLGNGYLFWDEPESNLNPKLIKNVVDTMMTLCGNGIQVFIATHSLFLMREFEISMEKKEHRHISARFIGLVKDQQEIRLHNGPRFDDIPVITALDEELNQSDRFIDLDE